MSIALPFEDAISPTVLTSIFRHMWSVSGGVVLGGINAVSVDAAKDDALVTCDINEDEVDDVSEVSTAFSVKSVSDSRDFELSSHLSQSPSLFLGRCYL